MTAGSGSANPKILMVPAPAAERAVPSRADRAVILPFPGARRVDAPALPPPVAPALAATTPLPPAFVLLMALAGVFAALVCRTIVG